jgi:hypothetical protein
MITNVVFRTFSSDYLATKTNSLYFIHSFIAIIAIMNIIKIYV